jgi:hypothetical protein
MIVFGSADALNFASVDVSNYSLNNVFMRNELVEGWQYGLYRVLPVACSSKELLFIVSRSYFKHSIFLVPFVLFERRKHLHFILIFYLP